MTEPVKTKRFLLALTATVDVPEDVVDLFVSKLTADADGIKEIISRAPDPSVLLYAMGDGEEIDQSKLDELLAMPITEADLPDNVVPFKSKLH